ncbi:MAG: hypothetical protein WEB52_03830 [Dehalococcoidia bacterium]
MDNTSPLLYEKTGDGVAWVTLNRPDVLNAVNMAMRDELWTLLARCARSCKFSVVSL